jgi:hypothetical protein
MPRQSPSYFKMISTPHQIGVLVVSITHCFKQSGPGSWMPDIGSWINNKKPRVSTGIQRQASSISLLPEREFDTKTLHQLQFLSKFRGP